MQLGDTLASYKVGELLGKGGFARVYECVSKKCKSKVAMKVIRKIEVKKLGMGRRLLTELRVHKDLTHKNIASLLKFFEDDERVYMILELCEGKITRHTSRLCAHLFLHA